MILINISIIGIISITLVIDCTWILYCFCLSPTIIGSVFVPLSFVSALLPQTTLLTASNTKERPYSTVFNTALSICGTGCWGLYLVVQPIRKSHPSNAVRTHHIIRLFCFWNLLLNYNYRHESVSISDQKVKDLYAFDSFFRLLFFISCFLHRNVHFYLDSRNYWLSYWTTSIITDFWVDYWGRLWIQS